jgi:succinate dehydrogenase/fumarate reductase flavoprotein subunit
MSYGWAQKPEDIPAEQISGYEHADIVIIGAGHAGTCAARAAAESGASVIVLEQQSQEKQWVLGIGEIGHINSKWQAQRGVPRVDIDAFVNDWQLRTGNRSNYRLIRKYAENCGACFDWFIEPLTGTEQDSIHAVLTPISEHFPQSINGFRAWSGTANMGVKLQDKALKGNQNIAVKHGARFIFEMTACQLQKDCSRVTGVIAVDKEGAYTCFTANKGVVLAAGDYSKNQEMCADLLTEAADLIEPGVDFSGHGWDGSGIRMGVWAGGRLEPRSHAAMGGNYSFPGFDVIGSTAVLRVNKYGERYSNEGFGTHILAAVTGARQPNGMLWGVFDSGIEKQIEHQAPCHAVFDYTEPGRLEKLRKTLNQAETAEKAGIQTTERRPLYCAGSIEELSGLMFEDNDSRKRFIAAVARYNDLCRQKADDDYGKEAHLLHAIERAPFYTCGQIKDSSKPGGQSLKLLVTVSGLIVDETQAVLNDNFEPIPGLFATGNCSGGRFGTVYTTSLPGQSISMAQTLGMVLGQFLTSKYKKE